jgi:hypothetical protein
MQLNEKTLETLSCDIAVRPSNAAGISEIMPFLLRVQTAEDAVIIDFDVAGKEAVASFVAAEQKCCTTLLWTLSNHDHILQLRIGGTQEQLSIIELWFTDKP